MRPVIFIASIIILMLSFSCGDSALDYYNLGVEAAERDDLDEAIELWRKSAEMSPEDPDTRYNLGMALSQKGEFAEAEEHFRASEKIRSDDYRLQFGLGYALEMQGKYSEAKRSYRYSIDLKSNFHPPYAGLAAIALEQELYTTAEKYAAEALRYSPHDKRGNLVLAEAYYMQQNYQAAYAQLISSRSWIGLEPDYLLLLGKVMNARRMFPDARQTLLEAKDAGISSSALFLHLGIASYEMGDFKESAENYRLALYREDRNIEAWKGLARSYHELDRLDDSLEAWKKAAALDPEDTEIQLGIAVAHIAGRDFENAVPVLEKLRAREDAPARTFYYLGHSLMRLGRRQEARDAFGVFLDRWEGDPSLSEEVRDILITL